MINEIFEKYFSIDNKKFLNESYGVSDTVNDISLQLFGEIKKSIEYQEWQEEWNGLKKYEVKKGNIVFQEKYGIKINYASYFIYNLCHEDEIDKIGIQMAYDEDSESVDIIWYAINKEMNYDRLYDYFLHEIMHCYQYSKGTNLNGKLYNSAIRIINGNDDNKTVYMLGQLIYWLSKPEIYAHCQQIYKQMIDNDIKSYDDLKKCETYKELEYIRNLMLHLNSNDGIFNYYQYFPEYFNNIDYVVLRKKINGSYNYAIHKISRTIFKYLNKGKITEKKILPKLKIMNF